MMQRMILDEKYFFGSEDNAKVEVKKITFDDSKSEEPNVIDKVNEKNYNDSKSEEPNVTDKIVNDAKSKKVNEKINDANSTKNLLHSSILKHSILAPSLCIPTKK